MKATKNKISIKTLELNDGQFVKFTKRTMIMNDKH